MREKPSFFDELKRRHVFRVAIAYVVVSWLLLQLGAIIFPALHAPSWCEAVLLVFLVLGFPVAVLLAWAFEVTPEGVRRTESVESETARSVTTGRRVGRTLDFVIIVILAAAVGVLLWHEFGMGRPIASVHSAMDASTQRTTTTTTSVPAKSIAVLPFANDSGDPNDRYFSDGLSEDLIIALSQYPGLKVIGRESSFHFRGSNLDGRAIGKQLGVAHLLEGSVSRAGNEVRIRAELVNAVDGTTLWSQHYDRPYKDLFALQDEITKAVASALEAKLVGSTIGAVVQTDRPPSGSLVAYNAYLQGNFYADRGSEADFRTAIKYYRQAVALDSNYAAAYAALSLAHNHLGGGFLGGDEMLREYAAARAAADKALALAPNLAAAYEARGTVLRQGWDWTRSAQAFRRALQLAPGSPQAQSDLAIGLATLGELQQAVELQRESLKVNPLDAHGYFRLATLLMDLGRLDEARKAVNQTIARQPAAPSHFLLALIEVLSGHPKAAVIAARKETSPSWRGYGLAIALEAAGEHAQAEAVLQTYIHDFSDVAAYQIAAIYAYRHQPDKALAWLERAWRNRDGGFAALLNNPFLKPYLNDPRFAAIRKKVGLPAPGSAPAATTTTMP